MYWILFAAALSLALALALSLYNQRRSNTNTNTCASLEDRVPEHADHDVNVMGLQPGAKAIYWVSEPATNGLATIKEWQRAYLESANAGVATVNSGGHAVFRVRGIPKTTVNWRICEAGGGLGPVQAMSV